MTGNALSFQWENAKICEIKKFVRKNISISKRGKFRSLTDHQFLYMLFVRILFVPSECFRINLTKKLNLSKVIFQNVPLNFRIRMLGGKEREGWGRGWEGEGLVGMGRGGVQK